MTSPRSIHASEDGRRAAQKKFELTGHTQDYLAGSAGCSRQTLNKFLAGRPIDKEKFKSICAALNVDWGEIADLDQEATSSIQAEDIGNLVVTAKKCIGKYIEARCGKMRVLDMTYPIGLSQIYTDVNILEKITSTQWKTVAELQNRVHSDKQNFNRLYGGEAGQRILGEDAVNVEHKLVVLGKPGSGKTTFLKHLAMQCLHGKFQPLRIPIFITLKEYSEKEHSLSILDFIKKELKKLISEETIELLFAQGRVLILLDGLDEVKEEELERVCEQIERFTSDSSELTQEFLIDKENHYEQRTVLEDSLRKLKTVLEPKLSLGKTISFLRQNKMPKYRRIKIKISNQEKGLNLLQDKLKEKTDEIKSIDQNNSEKINQLNKLIRKLKNDIKELSQKNEGLKKNQENSVKEARKIITQLSQIYESKIKNKKDEESDYEKIVQDIIIIYRDILDPDINELITQVRPIEKKLELEYPDLDEYPDKGLSFLSKKFPVRIYQNRFVVTCRIALDGINFTDFRAVEVADFDENQIKTFAKNWFTSNPEKKKHNGYSFFVEKLGQNDSVRELATSPLLLTLLCLVFEDAADFPKNRAQLYKEGIYILLTKWDADRFIYRRKSEKEIYKELSPNRKEDLFSKISCDMFEKGMYFFKQTEVESYIADYIRNLPHAKDNPDILRADSQDILKYIELQHGLLVERATGIYSFSHLTFQEYFTARKIVDTSNPVNLEKSLKSLASHITEKHWREVFLLAVGMISDAGCLLTLMKSEIDILIAGDRQLQEILNWVNESTNRVNTVWEKPAVRAFYLKYAYDIALANSPALKLEKLTPLDDKLASALDATISSELMTNACYLGQRLHEANSRLRHRQNNPEFAIDIKNTSTQDVFDLLACPDLQMLKEIMQKSDIEDETSISFQKWWTKSGRSWNESLSTIAQHPNINHTFTFNHEQERFFRRYYNANIFLVECLYSDCYMDINTRNDIENRLFTPLSVLEKDEEILIGSEDTDSQQETIRKKWVTKPSG
jgi:predicted NACHT family NTPase